MKSYSLGKINVRTPRIKSSKSIAKAPIRKAATVGSPPPAIAPSNSGVDSGQSDFSFFPHDTTGA